MIHPAWKNRMHEFITGIVRKNGHHLLQINSMPDHIHILIGYRPHQSLSDLVKQVKVGSSKWVNQNGLCSSKFAWQEGFGAFACSRSHMLNAVSYIQNQEIHHANKRFREEFVEFLERSEVEYDEKYIFVDPL